VSTDLIIIRDFFLCGPQKKMTTVMIGVSLKILQFFTQILAKNEEHIL